MPLARCQAVADMEYEIIKIKFDLRDVADKFRLFDYQATKKRPSSRISLADKNPSVKIVIFMVNALHGSVVK